MAWIRVDAMAIMRSGPLGNYCAALWLTGSDDALDVGSEVKVSD